MYRFVHEQMFTIYLLFLAGYISTNPKSKNIVILIIGAQNIGKYLLYTHTTQLRVCRHRSAVAAPRGLRAPEPELNCFKRIPATHHKSACRMSRMLAAPYLCDVQSDVRTWSARLPPAGLPTLPNALHISFTSYCHSGYDCTFAHIAHIAHIAYIAYIAQCVAVAPRRLKTRLFNLFSKLLQFIGAADGTASLCLCHMFVM